MSYFSKFPRYITKTLDNNQIVIADFFSRVAQSQRASDKTSVLLPYIILDGETPELVANKFYGTPFYHWILLLINDITNPRTEWPLESRYVISLIFDKYTFELTVDDTTQYAVGDVIESVDEGGKFIVTSVTDTVLLKSTVGFTTIALSTQLNNITKEVENLQVTGVIDPTEGVQHYIDTTTGLIVDFSNNPNVVPVTNLQYEEEENEKKRTIRILDPQFLDLFVRNFESQINE
jgi:hypothetical protein